MITAMQGAKLNTAERLRKARELLLETRSSIVWVDDLFRRLIP
jgi:transcriptional regulator GlxA family with amidase domain